MQVGEMIGVYNADGGLRGEAAYVLGKLRGTTHCGLCDITHGALRRKTAWDRYVERRGFDWKLFHLNELPPDAAEVVATTGAPVVLGRTVDGSLRVLLDAQQLDAADGSVTRFADLLDAALEQHR